MPNTSEASAAGGLAMHIFRQERIIFRGIEMVKLKTSQQKSTAEWFFRKSWLLGSLLSFYAKTYYFRLISTPRHHFNFGKEWLKLYFEGVDESVNCRILVTWLVSLLTIFLRDIFAHFSIIILNLTLPRKSDSKLVLQKSAEICIISKVLKIKTAFGQQV